MKLYYWKSQVRNFGDQLNPWLWPRILPGVFDDDRRTIFLGIGTLLNSRVPERPFKVIFGAGAGYGDLPVLDSRSWKIYCLRGPLTAKALGLPVKLAISDAAVLVRRLSLPRPQETYAISFMPHWLTAELGDWQRICRQIGFNFIDPRNSVDDVLIGILGTQLLVTEALHGAVVADAMRVPWIAVRTKSPILDFKWNDWCQSVELDYRPGQLPVTSRQELLSSKYLRARDALGSVAHQAMRKMSAGRSSRGGARDNRILETNRRKDVPTLARQIVRSADRSILRQVIPLLDTIMSRRVARARFTERAALALERVGKLEPQISSDEMIDSVTARLEEKLEMFKRDVTRGYFRR